MGFLPVASQCPDRRHSPGPLAPSSWLPARFPELVVKNILIVLRESVNGHTRALQVAEHHPSSRAESCGL